MPLKFRKMVLKISRLNYNGRYMFFTVVKSIKCTAVNMNPKLKYGLWVIMMY